MAVLLTYDVDSKHVEVKNRLISNYGYAKTLRGARLNDNRAAETDLPNTTVYHASKTASEATSDIINVTAALGVVLEKYVAFEVTGTWQGETSRLV
jgi:hypothetical protein